MSNAGEILAARERRRNIVTGISMKDGAVTVRANIPGPDKGIAESYLIVRHFASIMADVIGAKPVLLDGADGPAVIFDSEPEGIKRIAVELEEKHEIGRFVDIDVFGKNCDKSVSRGYMRKCYICGQPAFVCSRNKTHPTERLLTVLRSYTRSYFSKKVAQCVKEGLMDELNLENKFGLVTPTSRGSHKDLNYDVMQYAQSAIIPYITEMFFIGLDANEPGQIMERIRKKGISAEKAMYAATNGANAYKGFIFVGGVLLSAAGYTLGRASGNVFANVEKICADILGDFEKYPDSFGAQAYKTMGVTGVRGHAIAGFPVVEKAMKMIEDDESSKNLLKTLAYVVGEIDDTVLLKRSGDVETYRRYKELISTVSTDDDKAVSALTDDCVAHNISIGGSADVLAAAIMMKKLSKLFYCDFS